MENSNETLFKLTNSVDELSKFSKNNLKQVKRSWSMEFFGDFEEEFNIKRNKSIEYFGELRPIISREIDWFDRNNNNIDFIYYDTEHYNSFQ